MATRASSARRDSSASIPASAARAVLTLHADMADLIRLGAYRPGADPAVDEAVLLVPRIEAVLRQGREDTSSAEAAFARLAEAMDRPGTASSAGDSHAA